MDQPLGTLPMSGTVLLQTLAMIETVLVQTLTMIGIVFLQTLTMIGTVSVQGITFLSLMSDWSSSLSCPPGPKLSLVQVYDSALSHRENPIRWLTTDSQKISFTINPNIITFSETHE